MAIDHRCLTDEVEYFDPLTEDQKAKARRTIAGNAIDVDDAIEIMMMLGVHFSQEGELEGRTEPVRLPNMSRRR